MVPWSLRIVAAAGVIYLQSEYSASLYALRTSDGSLLWKYHAGALLAVGQGIAYVQDADDHFYALRASIGQCSGNTI